MGEGRGCMLRRIRQGLRDWHITNGARVVACEAFVAAGVSCIFVGGVALVAARAGEAAGWLALVGVVLIVVGNLIRGVR